jgi:hypothetical protein
MSHSEHLDAIMASAENEKTAGRLGPDERRVYSGAERLTPAELMTPATADALAALSVPRSSLTDGRLRWQPGFKDWAPALLALAAYPAVAADMLGRRRDVLASIAVGLTLNQAQAAQALGTARTIDQCPVLAAQIMLRELQDHPLYRADVVLDPGGKSSHPPRSEAVLRWGCAEVLIEVWLCDPAGGTATATFPHVTQVLFRAVDAQDRLGSPGQDVMRIPLPVSIAPALISEMTAQQLRHIGRPDPRRM